MRQETVARFTQRAAMFVALLAILVAQIGLGIDRSVPTTAPKAVPCKNAADPAFETVSAEKGDSSGGIDHYLIHVSVVNRGTRAQSRNPHQYVEILQNDESLKKIVVPSLQPGDVFALSTKFDRASEAGSGTTALVFRILFTNATSRTADDCNLTNDSYKLRF